jgi:hypothetical protein
MSDPSLCFAPAVAVTSAMTRRTALAVAAGLAVCGLAACGDSLRPRDPHPADLAGRWVRLREDGTWGDTMEFRRDGSMGGSAGYPVPAGLHWEVQYDSTGAAQFCAAVSNGGFCRPYRLAKGRLELIGGPRGSTVFRRVR